MGDRSGQAAPSTRTSKHESPKHPYEEFQGSAEWTRIEEAIAALVKNGDLRLMTANEYVVGYICKRLKQGGAR